MWGNFEGCEGEGEVSRARLRKIDTEPEGELYWVIVLKKVEGWLGVLTPLRRTKTFSSVLTDIEWSGVGIQKWPWLVHT